MSFFGGRAGGWVPFGRRQHACQKEDAWGTERPTHPQQKLSDSFWKQSSQAAGWRVPVAARKITPRLALTEDIAGSYLFTQC